MFSKVSLVAAATGLFLATKVNAAKVSSFSVCTDAWVFTDNNGSLGGGTAIYECKDDNVPDKNKKVGTYTFSAGPTGTSGQNNLYLSTDQMEINGCILQRTGTWDFVLAEPTEYGIWTTNGMGKGCPKASNIADFEYSSADGVGNSIFEMFTITLKRPMASTPLTTTTRSKE